MIRFPNLGIELEHVRSGISIFGIEITYFGILAGFGLILMASIILLEAYWSSQNMEEYANLIFVSTIVSIFGARGGYILLRWEHYRNHLEEIFYVRHGGLVFYGAVCAGIFIVTIYSLIRKLSVARVLDTFSIGIVAGQAVVSLGAFFNREGFGEYTNGLFAMQIPVDVVSSSAITEAMKKHITMLDGERFIQVTPLFMWEFVWCLFTVAVLCYLRLKKEFDGEVFLGMLLFYSVGQALYQGKCSDAICIPGTGCRIIQIVAIICAIISLILILYGRSQSDKARLRRMKEREARKFSKSSIKRFYIK